MKIILGLLLLCILNIHSENTEYFPEVPKNDIYNLQILCGSKIYIDLGLMGNYSEINQFSLKLNEFFSNWISNKLIELVEQKNAFFADHVIVAVSAENLENEFNIDYIKENALNLYGMGFREIIIAIDNMDYVDYNQIRFDELQNEIVEFLTNVGFERLKIMCIPISSNEGDNISDKSSNMAWYNGLTIIEAIDNLSLPQISPADAPLRFIVRKYFKIKGVGDMIQGKVLSGQVSTSDVLDTSSSQGNPIAGYLRSVEYNHARKDYLSHGTIFYSNITHLKRSLLPKIGDIFIPKTEGFPNVDSYICNVKFTKAIEIKNGSYFLIYAANGRSQSMQLVILSKIDNETGEILENPVNILNNEEATVKLYPTTHEPGMYLDVFKEYHHLGQFLIYDNNEIIGFGHVLKIKLNSPIPILNKK
jgi:elongation factor 1-alpha